MRATAASIFEKEKEELADKDEGTTGKTDKTASKVLGAASEFTTLLLPMLPTTDELPFDRIVPLKGQQGMNTTVFDNESKEDNTTSVITTNSLSVGTGGNSDKIVGEKHGPQDRFKVVKIETVTAKQLGRWTLVDYNNRSAPVVPQVPNFFPTLTSPAMSLAVKAPLKPNLKSSVSKPPAQPTQIQSGQAAIQPSIQKNIPAVNSEKTKVLLWLFKYYGPASRHNILTIYFGSGLSWFLN